MKRICVTHHICDCNMEQMQKLEKENAKLKLDIDGRKEAYSHLDDINIRLNVEIIRLKEQLKLAESQLVKAVGSTEIKENEIKKGLE